MREATSGETVKKQTSTDLVHNSCMTQIHALIGHRLAATSLALLLIAAGCTTVTPSPSPGPSVVPQLSPVATMAPTQSAPSTASLPTALPTPHEGETAGPTETPAPSVAQTPGATIDPAVAAQIDAVVGQVPPVRELEPTKDVPYELISRDDFRAEMISTVDEDTTPAWRAAESRMLQRLGLLPVGTDLDALLVELYSAEVAAYYRPETGTFYIIQRDQPFGPSDKVIVAHEYTHALQDQHFDLEGNRIKDPSEGDEALAQLAVIEGDATLTSQQWMVANMSEAEQGQLAMEVLQQLGQDQLANMPLILRRQLEFPYTEGYLFTRDIWSLGGYDAVNQAIQTPPASTEQVLHTDKYYNHEEPVAVSLTDLTSYLGSGFTNVYQQTMGELNIQVLATGGEKPPIDVPGLPAQWPHAEVAAGWGGDRLNMYESADGSQWLIDWQTSWDTPPDAVEFANRIVDLEPTFQGATTVFGTDAQSVEVVVASDASLFNALLHGGATPEPAAT